MYICATWCVYIYICMYVYIYVYMCNMVCIYICIYIYHVYIYVTCVYIYIYVTHVYIHVHMCICICECMYVYIYICTPTETFTYFFVGVKHKIIYLCFIWIKKIDIYLKTDVLFHIPHIQTIWKVLVGNLTRCMHFTWQPLVQSGVPVKNHDQL